MAIINKKKDEQKPMTLEEYIDNPFGKGSSAIPKSIREGALNTYKAKFGNIMLRENGKIKYYLFKDNTNNIYYCLVKVPSETIPKFYYDVAFKFFADSSIAESGRDLKKYYIQFFSNDPSFVYTYAYAFNQAGIFIPELASKMSKEALEEEPKERNPKQNIGYVKTIIFAYLFLNEKDLLKQSAYSSAESYTQKTLLDLIMDADEKISNRQREDKFVDHRKKLVIKDKNIIKQLNGMGIKSAEHSRLVGTTKSVGRVKGVKMTGNAKHAKRI